MSKFCMFVLPIFVLLLVSPVEAADRNPLLMGGQLGDGVASDGWALDKCVQGEKKKTLYKSPEISYTIGNTKKNGDSVVQVQVRLALGEEKIMNPKLTPEALKLKQSNLAKFHQLCGQRFYSGYIFGGVMSIGRKLRNQKQKLNALSITLSAEELEMGYGRLTRNKEFSGTYVHMNPVNQDLLGPKGEVQKILSYAQKMMKNKGQGVANIQPLTFEY